MDSNLSIEFSVIKKSCQDLFSESNDNWIKKNFELDNYDFLSLEALQLAGLSARALGPASWRASRLKKWVRSKW